MDNILFLFNQIFLLLFIGDTMGVSGDPRPIHLDPVSGYFQRISNKIICYRHSVRTTCEE